MALYIHTHLGFYNIIWMNPGSFICINVSSLDFQNVVIFSCDRKLSVGFHLNILVRKIVGFLFLFYPRLHVPNGQMLNRWLSEKNNSSVVWLRFRGAKMVKKCCMFCIL